ncbi:MAG: hypothetical protein ABI300_07875 [Rhodanobacter sp.]
MKLETMMLRSLAVTCSLVCVLVLGAMLVGAPAAAGGRPLTSGLHASSACPTPPDAVVCLRPAI